MIYMVKVTPTARDQTRDFDVVFITWTPLLLRSIKTVQDIVCVLDEAYDGNLVSFSIFDYAPVIVDRHALPYHFDACLEYLQGDATHVVVPTALKPFVPTESNFKVDYMHLHANERGIEWQACVQTRVHRLSTAFLFWEDLPNVNQPSMALGRDERMHGYVDTLKRKLNTDSAVDSRTLQQHRQTGSRGLPYPPRRYRTYP